MASAPGRRRGARADAGAGRDGPVCLIGAAAYANRERRHHRYGTRHELACAVHVHSTFSDGRSTVPEIVRAAAETGTDAVLLTDHDTLEARRRGLEGWHDGVLLLVGHEVSPRGGHYLAFGLDEEVDHRGRSEPEIAAAVARAGGVGFVAHPFSRGSAMSRAIGRPHGWRALESEGVTGIELWSLVTDTAEAWASPGQALRSCVPQRASSTARRPATSRPGTGSARGGAAWRSGASTRTRAASGSVAGCSPRFATRASFAFSARTSCASVRPPATWTPTARRSRRAGGGIVLPDGRAPIPADRPEGHDPGRRPGDRVENDGCRNLAILHDKEVYGAGLARNIENSAKELGLNVVTNEGIDPKAPNYRAVAASLRADGADCFVFSGITANGAVQLYKDVHAAMPDINLYGPDGVAESGFADPAEGGIPPEVQAKTKVTVATLAPDEYPPEGQEFFAEYERRYGEENPDPYAIYGYEAMDLILDTCDKLGKRCSDRQAMIDALFDTQGRKSVLGTYDIDENGDTTLTDYGVYRIEDGELVFDQTVKPEATPGGDAPGGGTGPAEGGSPEQ